MKSASASARWTSRFALRTEDLMAFISVVAVLGSDPWRVIIATIGAVIFVDASKQISASANGIVSPNPPSLAGSAKREHSTSEHGRPVTAGMNFSGMTCSRGCKRWPIPGIVLEI